MDCYLRSECDVNCEVRQDKLSSHLKHNKVCDKYTYLSYGTARKTVEEVDKR